jgi:cob(I)alamin adenosyltransferase
MMLIEGAVVRLTKIYTKIGDKGQTQLGTGHKISKGDVRIEAYGTIDELNAVMGLLRDHLMNAVKEIKQPSSIGQVGTVSAAGTVQALLRIQHHLFDLGGELSMPDVEGAGEKWGVSTSDVKRLEEEIDAMNATLNPLENFLLPGGHVVNSVSHMARTVCRRAERRLVSLHEVQSVRPETIIYLNRLSDWLFVFGRFISKEIGVGEILWDQRHKS